MKNDTYKNILLLGSLCGIPSLYLAQGKLEENDSIQVMVLMLWTWLRAKSHPNSAVVTCPHKQPPNVQWIYRLLMWQTKTNGQRGNCLVMQDRSHQQKEEPASKTLYVAWWWQVTCCSFVLVPLRCVEIVVQFTATYGPRGLQPIPNRLCAQVWSCVLSRNRGTCSLAAYWG